MPLTSLTNALSRSWAGAATKSCVKGPLITNLTPQTLTWSIFSQARSTSTPARLNSFICQFEPTENVNAPNCIPFIEERGKLKETKACHLTVRINPISLNNLEQAFSQLDTINKTFNFISAYSHIQIVLYKTLKIFHQLRWESVWHDVKMKWCKYGVKIHQNSCVSESCTLHHKESANSHFDHQKFQTFCKVTQCST